MSSESERCFTFADILREEYYVICDCSFTSLPGKDWYWDGVYEARKFSEVKQEELAEEIRCLRSFLSVLANPHAFTVPGIAAELKTAREMVAHKMKILKTRERNPPRTRKHYNGETQREQLQEIHDLFHESYREAITSFISPTQGLRYDVLEGITLRVTEETHAKLDFDSFYEKRRKPKSIPDFHADEQLAATAIYLSAIENTRAAVLTRDSDIERILSNTLNYLVDSDKRRHRQYFHRAVKNGVVIYYVTGPEEARLTFESSNMSSLINSRQHKQ